MRRMLFVAACLALAVPALSQQTIIRNPTGVQFTCPDHALDTGHEVDMVRASDNVVVQTIIGADPPADANGRVTLTLSTQPIAFGRYYFAVRSTAAGVKSDTSVERVEWERAPGRPGQVVPIP